MIYAEVVEHVDRAFVAQKVLTDLGRPAGAYIESIGKETSLSSLGVRDYWRLLVIVPGCPRLIVEHPAVDIPCEECGRCFPASELRLGYCLWCCSQMPYLV